MSNSQASVEVTSSQLWCQKNRKIRLCATVSLVVIFLSFIATGIVLVVNNRPSEEQNDSTVIAAARGSPKGEDEAVASNDQHGLSLEHIMGTATSLSPVGLRQTKAPSPSPSTDEPTTYVPTTYSPTTSYEPTTNNNNPLTFYAIGDVPYSDMEACLLPHELAKLSTSEGKFLVHLGDLQDGKGGATCPETLHENIASIFESSPLPTIFVIGDNEWLDCGGGEGGTDAAEESFAYWEKHLLAFHERTDLNWPPLDVNITRHADHPEFFAFLLEGVLFLGQGLPVPQPQNMPDPDEWDNYLEANANWTREHFVANVEQMRAAVILSHSSAGPVEPYFEELKKIASAYEQIPILLLEDNHWFEYETYREEPNLYRIALDDTVTPTSIAIDTDAKGGITKIFRYNRRCWCSSGHRPTKLMKYSSGYCDGVCDTNDLCAGENICGIDGATCW